MSAYHCTKCGHVHKPGTKIFLAHSPHVMEVETPSKEEILAAIDVACAKAPIPWLYCSECGRGYDPLYSMYSHVQAYPECEGAEFIPEKPREIPEGVKTMPAMVAPRVNPFLARIRARMEAVRERHVKKPMPYTDKECEKARENLKRRRA